MRLAYFDLDKTILGVNSGTLWVRRELALGHLSKRTALRAATWLFQYTLGFASADSMVEEAVQQVKGTSSVELRDRTNRFFHELVKHTYRPGALEAIEHHRRAGDHLVMLTSSTNYMAELVAADLRFDAVCSNELEVDALGLHTGVVVGGVCFGQGKLRHATRAAERLGGDVRHAAFYTDSFSDVAVMEVVAQPVAVNPDPRLKRRAFKRGWRVVDWGTAAPRVA